MDELLQLRRHIERGQYHEALALIDELEEMSRDDKASKIGSYLEILLIHLIKRHAENRSTRSWDVSINNAADAIRDVNQRRKSSGRYIHDDELRELIERRYVRAMRRASLEALEGRYDESELAARVDGARIRSEVMDLLSTEPNPQ